MKIDWAKVIEAIVTYGPAVLQVLESIHAVNQQQQVKPPAA